MLWANCITLSLTESISRVKKIGLVKKIVTVSLHTFVLHFTHAESSAQAKSWSEFSQSDSESKSEL